MSDTPQSENWWLASNGKWYPPTASSGMPLPPPPPTARTAGGPNKVPSGLSGTLQGFMWAAAATLAISALLGIGGFSALDSAWNSNGNWQAVEDIDTAIGIFSGLQVLIALVTFVLIIVWSYRAYSVSEALGANHRSFSSGWAIGAWFIPLANALLPRLVLRDIEKVISEQNSIGGGGSVQSSPPAALGWIWWASYVVCNALYVIGLSTYDSLDGTYETWQTGYTLIAFGGGGYAVSAVLGALYIRGLTRSVNMAATSAGQSTDYQ